MIYASFYDRLQVHVDLPLSFQIALETCFASHSAPIMSKSFTALQVLLRLQDISVDCSDGEDSNSELNDAMNNDLEKVEKNQVSVLVKTMTAIHQIKCR